MWVDIDDVRAELKCLMRETGEEFAEEDGRDEDLLQFRLGKLFGYTKVEQMLDELEEAYRKRESECVRGLEVYGNEE